MFLKKDEHPRMRQKQYMTICGNASSQYACLYPLYSHDFQQPTDGWSPDKERRFDRMEEVKRLQVSEPAG